MPDMLMPQVPPAPAPAKPAANSARPVESKPDSEADQEFSSVLKTRMQPEEKAAQAESEGEATVTAGSADTEAATGAEGKSLPQTGNVEDPALAVLVPLLTDTAPAVTAEAETVSEADAATVSVTAATLGITGLPGDSAEVMPATAPAPAEAAAGRKPEQRAADVWQARGPWKAGAAEVPEAAQKAVAQAVRSAVAESGEDAAPLLTPERFGAEVRAAVAANHNRAPGLEAALERLTANAAQPTTSTSAPAAAQTLSAPAAAQDVASARPALPTTTVDTHLRQPGWDQALGERVLWAANQKFQGAEIKLNPAHLGPVEVRVQLHNDQAQISFTAQHATTRDALEAALPRLREMFSASGYNLVDVNVSQHSFAEQRHAQSFEGRFQAIARNGDDAETAAGPLPGTGRLTGLPTSAIDVFA